MRRSRSRLRTLLLAGAALAFVALGGACTTSEGCPGSGVIESARATDPTRVEVKLACPVSGASAETVTVTSAARAQGLVVAEVTGSRTLTIVTEPQVGLVTYTVRLDGVRGPDGAPIVASANFVGVGDVPSAEVTLRVDDRYHASLDDVSALVSFDPETGVFTHFQSRVQLADPDGDHVWEATARVAVDPLRTISTLDDRLGPERQAYAAVAVSPKGAILSRVVTFEVRDPAPVTVGLPLLSVPNPPGPEGLVEVRVRVDDTPARALVAPSLRVSANESGEFDPSFPTTLPLVDPDGDRVFEATARVRIDPKRRLGGHSSETLPYVLFIADEGVDYPGVGTAVEALDEMAVDASIRVGNPALVPVTFRVDVSAAYLNPTGSLRGLYPGEAVFLTGEFGGAEDAFGQNASDAFTGGENVVLEMKPRADHPGVWERTIFLAPDRPYGWKVVRCPAGKGCADLNRHVTSSGRAFATVMKNLATENRDAASNPDVRIVDPRAPVVTLAGGGTLDYAGAQVYVGTGTGTEPDPAGTPDGVRLFKQEMPDLVVEVGASPVVTPVVVVGTWRDVNLPTTLAEIVAMDGVFDLNPWDYDSGFVGVGPPSYELAPPPPPPPFVIGDGAIDAVAKLVPGGGPGTMTLHAALSGTTLYVATQDAGEGSDHFLFVSAAPPGAPLPAPWAKAGTVALPGSAIFLADENDGPFAGWFALGTGALLEAAGPSSRPDLDSAAAGGVLEGTVDLVALFGAVPDTIYLVVGPWASPDGGGLYASAQMPATVDGDGDVDAPELAAVPRASIEVTP